MTRRRLTARRGCPLGRRAADQEDQEETYGYVVESFHVSTVAAAALAVPHRPQSFRYVTAADRAVRRARAHSQTIPLTRQKPDLIHRILSLPRHYLMHTRCLSLRSSRYLWLRRRYVC